MSRTVDIVSFVVHNVSSKGRTVAENDKFERGLAKHWRRPYRLASAGAAVPVVVDAMVSAARLTLADEVSCHAINELSVILNDVLSRSTAVDQPSIFPGWDNRFQYLEIKCEEALKNDEAHPSLRLVADAAVAVFSKLSSCQRNAQAIRDAFAEAVTARLVDHRLISRVRDGLMERCSRTVEEQRKWEADVLRALEPQARLLFKTIFREDRVPKRSPTRLHHRARFTLDNLHAPLPSLAEGSND
jgi:hypothetical protein